MITVSGCKQSQLCKRITSKKC